MNKKAKRHERKTIPTKTSCPDRRDGRHTYGVRGRLASGSGQVISKPKRKSKFRVKRNGRLTQRPWNRRARTMTKKAAIRKAKEVIERLVVVMDLAARGIKVNITPEKRVALLGHNPTMAEITDEEVKRLREAVERAERKAQP